MLRAALRVPRHPPRQYVRAEQGATIVDIPLGEEEARHLIELLTWAVQALEAEKKDKMN